MLRVPAVLMAVLGLMGAALAGCGGAADIADHTGGGLTTTSTTSNERPATAPTPPSFANLPDGFGIRQATNSSRNSMTAA